MRTTSAVVPATNEGSAQPSPESLTSVRPGLVGSEAFTHLPAESVKLAERSAAGSVTPSARHTSTGTIDRPSATRSHVEPMGQGESESTSLASTLESSLQPKQKSAPRPVSYTHLTLPTSDL